MKSCQININKEIKILKDLKHNWFWNEGREYSKIELKYISLFLLEFNKHFLIKNTRVYPTINNEIELEWCNSLFDISIKLLFIISIILLDSLYLSNKLLI